VHADFHRKSFADDAILNSRMDNSGFARRVAARIYVSTETYVEQLPQMERFCRACGNTEPREYAAGKYRRPRRPDVTALRILEFVHEAYGSLRADLVRVEIATGDAISGNSQSDVPAMGV
jgi:hypothetical protein